MADTKISEPAPNWCRTCGRRPNDPMAALCLDTHHRTLERLHPQPAELAEQQQLISEIYKVAGTPGMTPVDLADWIRDVLLGDTCALAATGKQQVGEVHTLNDVHDQSFIEDCFIKVRAGDPPVFTDIGNGLLVVRMRGYNITPKEYMTTLGTDVDLEQFRDAVNDYGMFEDDADDKRLESVRLMALINGHRDAASAQPVAHSDSQWLK